MNNVLSKYLFYYPATLANGENVSRYLKQYRKSQFWTKEDMDLYQEAKLKELLKVAMTSNFYSKIINIDELTGKTGNDFFRSFSEVVPYLNKNNIIENRDGLRTTYGKKISKKTTGGSTGEPVTVMKDSIGLARERAATWRAYEWAGIAIGSKQARFWGVPHSSINRLKSGLIDFIANRKRYSAFNLSDDSLNKVTTEIIQNKPDYLYGYVSAIRLLAEYANSNKNMKLSWPMKCVITTSEVLTLNDRKIMENAFGCRVYNEYGCGEVGSIAHECESGSMHIMAENVYLEQTAEGELVVTDLNNKVMPLIRYKIGDFASIGNGPCTCGRSLPIIEGISGRAYDLISTPEGRKIHPEAVIYIFEDIQKKIGCFNQFQVIQTTPVELLLKLVPSSSWTSEAIRHIILEVSERISKSMEVDVQLVKSIEREKSGKMRVVKSLL